jgi:hypothetical protein
MHHGLELQAGSGFGQGRIQGGEAGATLTAQNPSASLSATVTIGLLEQADRLLAGFGAITLLADRAFPCDALLGWFHGRDRWRYVMRLPGDTEIHGTAAPLG